MTLIEIRRFFNLPESTEFKKETILDLLKEKFGFPIAYTPEGTKQSLVLSPEESILFYQNFESQILDGKYENIILLNNQIYRDLDSLYDIRLDSSKI